MASKVILQVIPADATLLQDKAIANGFGGLTDQRESNAGGPNSAEISQEDGRANQIQSRFCDHPLVSHKISLASR